MKRRLATTHREAEMSGAEALAHEQRDPKAVLSEAQALARSEGVTITEALLALTVCALDRVGIRAGSLTTGVVEAQKVLGEQARGMIERGRRADEIREQAIRELERSRRGGGGGS